MTTISRRFNPLANCAAIALVFGVGLSSAFAAPLVGRAAPDFALKSLNGTNIRLSEFQGQIIIVNFWARWAGGSRREFPLLEKIHSTYRRAGVVVLGVSVDEDLPRAMQFARSLPVTYPLMFDVSYGIGKDYGLVKLPVTYVIDRGGIVRYVHEGFSRDAEKDYVAEIRELLSE